MDNDKARELVSDATETEYLSSCCGAPLYWFNDGVGMCSDCKEWASGERELTDPPLPAREFSPEQLRIIATHELEDADDAE